MSSGRLSWQRESVLSADSRASSESPLCNSTPSGPPGLVFGLLAVGAGTLVVVASYESITPIVMAIFFPGLGLIILRWGRLGGKWEQAAYLYTFAACWLASGVAQFTERFWGLRKPSDAESFFRMSTQGSQGLSLDEIRAQHSGALAIYVWREIYNVFGALGAASTTAIGIAVNVTLISAASVALVKVIKNITGSDSYHLRRLLLLICLCPPLLFLGSVHLRDAWLYFILTLLVAAWSCALNSKGAIKELLVAGCSTLVSFLVLYYLRSQWIVLPALFALWASFLLLLRARNALALVAPVSIGVGLWFSLTLLGFLELSIFYLIVDSSSINESFVELSRSHSSATSLGAHFLVEGGVIARTMIGLPFFLLGPIPATASLLDPTWGGILGALSVPYSTVVLALALISILNYKNQSSTHWTIRFFLVGIYAMGLASVLYLTLDSRHIVPFLAPIFLLAALPDLRIPRVRKQFLDIVILMVICIAALNAAWLVLKNVFFG